MAIIGGRAGLLRQLANSWWPSLGMARMGYVPAMADLDPRVPEFESTEAAERIDCWFRAKVEAMLAAAWPTIPHEQVMAYMEAILVAAEAARWLRARRTVVSRDV